MAMIALFVALGGTAGAVVPAAVPLAKRALVADNAKKLGGQTTAQIVAAGAKAASRTFGHPPGRLRARRPAWCSSRRLWTVAAASRATGSTARATRARSSAEASPPTAPCSIGEQLPEKRHDVVAGGLNIGVNAGANVTVVQPSARSRRKTINRRRGAPSRAGGGFTSRRVRRSGLAVRVPPCDRTKAIAIYVIPITTAANSGLERFLSGFTHGRHRRIATRRP